MNWTMLVLVILLVLSFKTSTAIAAAYGIAVSGTMVLTTALVAIVTISMKKRPNPLLLAVLALIGLVELVFFAANATKIADGGWFPLACGFALFIMLTTWKRAETILTAHEKSRRVPINAFSTLCSADIPRVSGTAVYLSPDEDSVPGVLLHNLKHNKVLHERIVFLTIHNADTAHPRPGTHRGTRNRARPCLSGGAVLRFHGATRRTQRPEAARAATD